MEQEIFINSSVTEELRKYGKYIKYTRDGLIKHKNYNWLVLDSNYNTYKKLVARIMEYNYVADINTRILSEVDFTNRRGVFMQEELKSAIENRVDVNKNNPRGIYSGIVRMKQQCNIIVLGSITDEGTATQEYGQYCTFFVNLNSVVEKEEKDIKIDQFIAQNHFTVSDDVRTELTNLDEKNYERLITRGFISALQDGKRQVLCRTDVFPSTDTTSTEVLQELDGLIGLTKVKEEIKQIYNYLLVAKQRKSQVCTNMLFLGNPGTGKTTVAHILARLFATVNGTTSKLPIVFESRETLVGQYLGHTEANVIEAVKKAQGGILFIDEAYSLSGDDYHDFGHRAIDVLVNQMDIHRYDITFIFARISYGDDGFYEIQPWT